MSFEVRDWQGKPITVGRKCRYGELDSPDDVVEVVSISEPDGDWNDELGRAVRINPRVKVRFPNGDEDTLGTTFASRITWADYPDGPDPELYEAEDIEVLATPTSEGE